MAGTLPDDFQKRLKLFRDAGLESRFGQFSGKSEQIRALKTHVRGGVGSPQNVQRDIEKATQRALEQARIINQPAVQSLQAAIPETQQAFSTERARLTGEVEPLKARYKNLLDQIKGRETQAIQRQTLSTQRELGRRGIQGGGLAEQQLTSALNPITSEFAGLATEAGLGQEADIRNIQNAIASLTGQETAGLRNIRNTIAQLQAGTGQSAVQNAIQQALSLAQIGQQGRQFDVGSQLQRAQQALSERQFQEILLPESRRALEKPFFKPESGGLSDIQSLLQFLAGNQGNAGFPPSFKPD